MPSWLTVITPTSPARPWRAAAKRPRPKASTVVSTIAISASGTVTARRSPTSCAIGVSYAMLVPRSPVARPFIQSP